MGKTGIFFLQPQWTAVPWRWYYIICVDGTAIEWQKRVDLKHYSLNNFLKLLGNCSADTVWCCEMKIVMVILTYFLKDYKTLFSTSDPCLTMEFSRIPSWAPHSLSLLWFKTKWFCFGQFVSSCTCIFKPYLTIGKYPVPFS